MELTFIAVALLAGLLAQRLALPPLVGFLLAGFGLHAAGYDSTPLLERSAEIGVTLLLFSIGLKLRLRGLAAPIIWAGTSLTLLLSVGLGAAWLLLLGAAGLLPGAGLDPGGALLVAFALGFSSTVLAVKLLDERGEARSLHGRIAVGALIVQDLFAVIWIAVVSGQTPSAWAACLLLLVPLRGRLQRLLDWAGHGELLVLQGIVFSLGAWWLFDFLGVKGDLGALVVGALLAGSTKADELSGALLGLKDLLLVCFFLTIGLSSPASLSALGLAALLLLLVPLKVAVYAAVFLGFRLRVRTTLSATSTLANFSEFGLLVGSVGVAQGLLAPEWLAILALALSATFLVGAWTRRLADRLYLRQHDRLLRWQRRQRLPGDEPIDPGRAEAIVLGMGRVGTDLYDAIRAQRGDVVVGVDQDARRVQRQREAGRRVLQGDASDVDFWDRVVDRHAARMILMTMTSAQAKLRAARIIAGLSANLPEGQRAVLGAVVRFEDEQQPLHEAGVELVHDVLSEAGHGFGARVLRELGGEGVDEA